jgi:hypothetical protein
MIYFISGHRDITEKEFKKYYISKMDQVLKEDKDAKFVVGDYEGVDIMAQEYLVSSGYLDRVTVYHMFTAPRNIASPDLKTSGGYVDDIDRDSAMTRDSDFDIAFYRPVKGDSGTFQNIRRRGIIK